MAADGGPVPDPERPQVRNRKIVEIEALRGVAILMVLVQHMPDNLIFWPSRVSTLLSAYGQGWTGVDLFFVISGFVITRRLLPETRSAASGHRLALCIEFYRRRAWRLLPSAWLWLGIILLGCVAFNRSGAFRGLDANIAATAAAILDVMNFHMAEMFGHGDAGLAFAYWSLSLEEQFYALLPVMLLCLGRYSLVVLAAMLASTLLPATPLGMMTRTGGLACGVLLAWAFNDLPAAMSVLRPDGLATRRLWRAALPVMSIALLFILGAEGLRVVSFRLLPIALICAMLVWIAAYDRGFLFRAGPVCRVLHWVGARSYSLYLVHIPLFATAHELAFRVLPPDGQPRHGQAWLYVCGALAGCMIAADLNYRLVERPTHRRAQRRPAPVRFNRTQMVTSR